MLTSASRPNTASCSWAAGRLMSRDARSAFLFCWFLNRKASFAAVVVFPDPWSPTNIITDGGFAFKVMGTSSEPNILTKFSCTILITIWPGVTLFSTSTPTARSLTWSTKFLTTARATSASSSAMRTSRKAFSTSVLVRTPRLVRCPNTSLSRLVKLSNMVKA